MSDFVDNGYELGWDAEIENEGSEFVVVEPGDYDFTVINFERGRFQGSTKMPPCNQAKLTIRLDLPEGACEIKHNLFLQSKTEWKLCEFFTAIGQRQSGQRVVMNWNAVVGSRGRCKVSKRSFVSNKDGKTLWANDIDKFYPPQNSAPVSTQQSAPAASGYTPGKF
ncbi:MAG: DUF669 domain-containing protein [Oscillospiraceae bacterium]|nr:DUF669 domain-containing protein [Oscillospiraceae bacterium]